MYSHQVKLPVDLMYGSTPHQVNHSLSDYAYKLCNDFKEAYVLAQQNGINEQNALYNVKVHGAPYQVGDLAWLHTPAVPRGQCRKLHHTWTGPLK